jgi:hypothetical protein
MWVVLIIFNVLFVIMYIVFLKKREKVLWLLNRRGKPLVTLSSSNRHMDIMNNYHMILRLPQFRYTTESSCAMPVLNMVHGAGVHATFVLPAGVVSSEENNDYPLDQKGITTDLMNPGPMSLRISYGAPVTIENSLRFLQRKVFRGNEYLEFVENVLKCMITAFSHDASLLFRFIIFFFLIFLFFFLHMTMYIVSTAMHYIYNHTKNKKAVLPVY